MSALPGNAQRSRGSIAGVRTQGFGPGMPLFRGLRQAKLHLLEIPADDFAVRRLGATVLREGVL